MTDRTKKELTKREVTKREVTKEELTKEGLTKEQSQVKEYVLNRLYEKQDLKYRAFQAKLVPGIDKAQMIGVRTPDIRAIAKDIINDKVLKEEFLNTLPHKFYDENILHGAVISYLKDYSECIERLEAFLPFVDNWCACDLISPKIFAEHKPELIRKIREWAASKQTYTVRFAVTMLMSFYLGESFDEEFNRIVAGICSEEYYINMARAWYFATALAKQWDLTVSYMKKGSLDEWTRKKSIQKATESRRITPGQKEYLRMLK